MENIMTKDEEKEFADRIKDFMIENNIVGCEMTAIMQTPSEDYCVMNFTFGEGRLLESAAKCIESLQAKSPHPTVH